MAASRTTQPSDAGSAQSFLRHFLAGAVGGSVAAALLCPLDVMRTRLQSSQSPKLSPVRLFLHIVRNEGPLALYRGLVPTVLGVGPSRAFYFGSYGALKARLASEPAGLSGAALHLSAAALGGILTNTIMSPWWVIRLRMQLQETRVEPFWKRWLQPSSPQIAVAPAPLSVDGLPRSYRGVFDAASRIYREEGLIAFYRGLSASYLGVGETALQFMLYGHIKNEIVTRELELHPPPPDASDKQLAHLHAAAFTDSHALVTGGLSKFIASAATYPHEVIRTRMREKRVEGSARYSSIARTAMTVAREEGLRGLYGGVSVHLLRTVR